MFRQGGIVNYYFSFLVDILPLLCYTFNQWTSIFLRQLPALHILQADLYSYQKKGHNRL